MIAWISQSLRLKIQVLTKPTRRWQRAALTVEINITFG
jgi:hypothetical protein